MATDVEEEIGKTKKSLLWMKERWIAVVVGVLIGGFTTSWMYETFRLDAVRDRFAAAEQSLSAQKDESERREKFANEKLSAMEDFEKKYIEEKTRSHILDKKVQELELDVERHVKKYEELLAMKWEEKLNAEKLIKISAQEEVAVLRQRLNDSEQAQTGADPNLIKQVALLQAQIGVVEKERDELKRLYLVGFDNETNTTPCFVLADDLLRKRSLLNQRRKESLARLAILRDQMAKFCVTFCMKDALDIVTTNKRIPNEDFLLNKFLGESIKFVLAVDTFQLHIMEHIYSESERQLTDGLHSPMEKFLLTIKTKPRTLENAETITMAIANLDIRQNDLFEKATQIIENHYSKCKSAE